MGTTAAGFLGAVGWVFDLAANLRTQLAVLLLVLSVVSLGAGRRSLALGSLAATIVNLALILPLLSGTPAPAAADAETLDITFFNTKIRAEPDAVIDHLAARDDDVVVLTATSPRWVGALEAADLDLHVVSGAHLTSGLEIVVMTRDPDVEVTVHRLGAPNRDSLVEVVIAFDGGPVHVLGGHLVSPRTPGRAARRDQLLGWIAAWSAQRTAPVVVAGDLNATAWSTPFRTMLAEGGLHDPQRDHGLQPSWPAWAGPFGLAIDHVLHSDELTTVTRALGPAFGSDHRMVHVRIARAAEVVR